MTLREYAKIRMKELVEQEGGLRKASRKIGMDPSTISKIINDTYHPGLKTLVKYFPECDKMKFEGEELIVQTTVLKIECKEIDELKAQLNKLGYEMHIEFIKKKDV